MLMQVDAAVVAFRLKQSSDYPPVSSIKSFFSMVITYYYVLYYTCILESIVLGTHNSITCFEDMAMCYPCIGQQYTV